MSKYQRRIRRIQGIVFFLFWMFTFAFGANEESGYRIEVTLEKNTGDTLKLGYYFGKSQYLKDTAIVDKGKFVFEGAGALAPGVYLIVIPPDNKFVHILVSEDEQQFSVYIDMDNIVTSAKFKGSEENTIYYNYLKELESRRPRADELRKKMVEDSLNKAVYKAEVDIIDQDVKKVQQDLVRKHPASITAMLIKANQDIDIPEYTDLPEEERKLKQYEYYRAHYFDHFDLSDPRAMRSGLMQTKIDFFLQKLSYQYPDSQIVAIDYLLNKMMANKEAFQFYLVHFLNEAAKSKRMGMDAVYVHLIDNYYAKGFATWTEEESLKKLIGQADATRPLLIGKTAPNLTFYTEAGAPIAIHSLPVEYTVLFFWDPECGHCKKSMPFVIDFYNAYKDKGVEILGICTKTGEDISACWSTIKEKGMDIWVNAADQYIRNRYKTIYDVKTTPQIFILDKDKKIIVKKIGGEDLATVMDELLKMKK